MLILFLSLGVTNSFLHNGLFRLKKTPKMGSQGRVVVLCACRVCNVMYTCVKQLNGRNERDLGYGFLVNVRNVCGYLQQENILLI
jgi:hypothetical protein